MISGSLALNHYVKPRMTVDLDLIIELTHANKESFINISNRLKSAVIFYAQAARAFTFLLQVKKVNNLAFGRSHSHF